MILGGAIGLTFVMAFVALALFIFSLKKQDGSSK
jgi:hypothetical protein